MDQQSFGANEFTFTGDRTQITFLPVAPGPIHPGQGGGSLHYTGPEGDLRFSGSQIVLTSSPIGTLVTVALRAQRDTGAINVTVLLPHITGVTQANPVSFETVSVKSTSRGFISLPGADRTYTIIPLLGIARDVLLPLETQASASAGQGTA
jgi:hypothetical protein